MTTQVKSLPNQPHFDAVTINQASQTAMQADQHKPVWRKWLERYGGIGVVLIALGPILPTLVAWVSASEVRLTAPDFSVLARISLAVQIHLASVMICLPLGVYILWGAKGTTQHKMLGRIWVGAMVVTCVSALFIKSFSPLIGPFGLIHLMVLWTLLSLGRGMHAIIVKRDLPRHLRNMQGAFWGLIIAGLFSFIPGRLLWNMFTSMQ